jgi:polar amino acid transport system permease protein
MSLWTILDRHGAEFAFGLQTTVELCLIVWISSLVFGSILGVLSQRFPRSVGGIIVATAVLLGGIPPIVFLFWLYYPAQAIVGVSVPPFPTAAIGLSAIGVTLVADLVRQTFSHFPKHYITAARVLGVPNARIITKIVFPIAMRSAFPTLLLIIVTLFQMTFFAAFLSVPELFRVAQQVNSIAYRPVEIYTALAAFCLIVSVPIHILAAYLKSRWAADLSDR